MLGLWEVRGGREEEGLMGVVIIGEVGEDVGGCKYVSTSRSSCQRERWVHICRFVALFASRRFPTVGWQISPQPRRSSKSPDGGPLLI